MNEITNYQQPATHYLAFKPGLTLIELVTSFAIIGVLGIMLGSIYLASFKLFSNQTITIDIQAQNTIAINEMANNIKIALRTQKCNNLFDPSNPCDTANAVDITDSTISLSYYPLDDNSKPLVGEAEIVASSYCQGWQSGTGFLLDYIWYEVDVDANLLYRTTYTFSNNPDICRSSRLPENCASLPTDKACWDKDIIATNIKALNFRYFGIDGTELFIPPSVPNLVYKVQIDVITEKNTLPPKPIPIVETQSKTVNLINKP